MHVAAALATSPLERGARGLIAEAFDRPLASIERDWRDDLDSLSSLREERSPGAGRASTGPCLPRARGSSR